MWGDGAHSVVVCGSHSGSKLNLAFMNATVLRLNKAAKKDGFILASEDGYLPGKLTSIKYREYLTSLVVNTYPVSYKV